jgi:hypothetical protein
MKRTDAPILLIPIVEPAPELHLPPTAAQSSRSR